KSIVTLADKHYPQSREALPLEAQLIPFTAETRMSGVDWNGQQLRKGSPDAMKAWVQSLGGTWPNELDGIVQEIAGGGATPLVVCSGAAVLG
ncbi:potassium-transporting ATPase subunit B, partial [Acidithiobacillus ferrooxidans]|nr:potassium-transporting ATPase subunit B [Acidithiobacillus ferrooxidans]